MSDTHNSQPIPTRIYGNFTRAITLTSAEVQEFTRLGHKRQREDASDLFAFWGRVLQRRSLALVSGKGGSPLHELIASGHKVNRYKWQVDYIRLPMTTRPEDILIVEVPSDAEER